MQSRDKNILLAGTDNYIILIAEDDRAMRMIIQRALEQEGYSIVQATNGQECLELFKIHKPDLVLVDALMPKLNGFEVCKQLQALPDTERVPILMVTGLEDSESVDAAFRVGATDYITKPIHWAVLRQRVRRILESRRAEKLRDDLIHMVVHDMKNPLTAVLGSLDMLLFNALGELNLSQRDAALRAQRNSQVLLDMAMMILDLRRMEESKLSLQLEKANVLEMLQTATNSLDWMAQNYGVVLRVENTSPNLTASLDWNLIKRVLTNLISNAIKHSPKGSQVLMLAAQLENGSLQIVVKDEGEGIALEDQSQIFDRFVQATRKSTGSRNDTGLGLTFCKLVVEAHGGKITLESTVGVGSTFTLHLPSL